MATKKPILIIGAGLSGLATARLLANASIPAVVFESAPPTRSQGYAISLHEWAFSPLLSALGDVPIPTLQRAVAPDRYKRGTGWIDQAMRDVSSGETLMAPEHEGEGKQQMVFRANRNALRQWLSDVGGEEIDVRYEHRLKSISGAIGSLEAEFENGAVFSGSLIVAADGLHSTVRSLLHPHVTPDTLPATVFHGDLHVSHLTFDSFFAPHFRGSNILAGVGNNFNTPLTISNMDPRGVHLDWSYSRPAFHPSPDDPKKQIQDPLFQPQRTAEEAKVVPESLLSDLENAKLARPFRDILNRDMIRENGCYNWLSQSVFVPRPELDAAIGKGVVFVGDSAHAMPIFGGEGGNHALLDAVELVERLVEGGSVKDGLRQCVETYYGGAFRRTQGAVRRCRQRFLLLHRPIGEWRELAVKRDEKVMD